MTYEPKSGEVVGIPVIVADPPRAFGAHHIVYAGANRCIENVSPWLSHEEWEAIRRLVQLAREIVTLCPPGKWPARNRAPIAALKDTHDLLEDAAPLIERMGWT
jgi:hypothetical protein